MNSYYVRCLVFLRFSSKEITIIFHFLGNKKRIIINNSLLSFRAESAYNLLVSLDVAGTDEIKAVRDGWENGL